MPQDSNPIGASPRPTVTRKLLAAFLYPLDSEKRKAFRGAEGGNYYERIRRNLIVGARNIGAIIRHPFSSKKRKLFRERTPLPRVLPRREASYYRVYLQYANTAMFVGSAEIGALAFNPPPTSRCDVKLIAYYLPQFHPIPENDRNWGKGFTEWHNVAKAVPAFVGHYQPRQPGELGFYDLRVVDVMRRQVELAKLYGISAFCFHFYWFAGRRLLELPLQNYLQNRDLDLPFCLCWANENWSRRWDGSENEILVGQSHSPEDDIAFLRYLKRYFDDPRYLKIDGKPVLTVYRPSILPNMKETVARWRREISEMGFPGIFLIATNAFDFTAYEDAGFDALSEFPPHGVHVGDISGRLGRLIDYTAGVYSYEDVVEKHAAKPPDAKLVLPGVMPSWDNSARRPFRGGIFHGSTPALFEKWLDASVKRAKQNPDGRRFVFVNAWNEWAEGAYLEPDRRYGYAYLSACASVIRKHASKDSEALDLLRRQREQFQKTHDKAVALHLFYEDLAPRFAEHLRDFEKTDLFITVCDDISAESARTLISIFPTAYFQEVENRGRDIKPFLMLLDELSRRDYEFVCKIHSKRSSHLQQGELWRDQLVSTLLSEEASRALASAKRRKDIAMLAASNSVMTLSDPAVRYNTEPKLIELTRRMGIPFNVNEKFVAGSMFWVKPRALKRLAALYDAGIDFDLELGQIDGTVAHAIERLFAMTIRWDGYKLEEFGKTVQNPYAQPSAAE